ncbi:Lysophospholipase (EC 3.1.1.5), partial [Pseudomonas sp. FEN]
CRRGAASSASTPGPAPAYPPAAVGPLQLRRLRAGQPALAAASPVATLFLLHVSTTTWACTAISSTGRWTRASR